MSESKLSSREKIVRSAISLYATQGITATPTKQIADQAGVNEVTLFRQFGSKQGLLLAVLQEAPILERVQAELAKLVGSRQPLIAYGTAGLALLEEIPELVRSLIGEAGQSPPENRRALGQLMRAVNAQTLGYFRAAQISLATTPELAASLLNTLILGYALLEFSSDRSGLWQNETDFLRALEELFTGHRRGHEVLEGTGAPAGAQRDAEQDPENAMGVEDLPAEQVRSLFQKARKHSPQAYALVYVLFGAGLRLQEAARLQRSQSLASKTQHILTVLAPQARYPSRQVPLNRWIMGHRYGNYQKNPLTQWLKTRADDHPAVFVSESGEPLGEAGLSALWRAIAAEESTASGQPPTPFQARQTWCIELLLKGMSLENLSILSGLDLAALAPYAQRAREKAALEEALAIDQKRGETASRTGLETS